MQQVSMESARAGRERKGIAAVVVVAVAAVVLSLAFGAVALGLALPRDFNTAAFGRGAEIGYIDPYYLEGLDGEAKLAELRAQKWRMRLPVEEAPEGAEFSVLICRVGEWDTMSIYVWEAGAGDEKRYWLEINTFKNRVKRTLRYVSASGTWG